MTLTRPPTPPKVLVSHALVLVALGSTLSIPLLGFLAAGFVGFSGHQWPARDLILLGAALGMCVAAVLCWRWPRSGTLLFAVLWVVAFVVCRGEPETATECFHQLITMVIGGAFLLVNLLVTEIWLRGSRQRPL